MLFQPKTNSTNINGGEGRDRTYLPEGHWVTASCPTIRASSPELLAGDSRLELELAESKSAVLTITLIANIFVIAVTSLVTLPYASGVSLST